MRAQRSFVDPRPAIWAGLVCLLVLTVIFYTTDWDRDCARYFWALGHGQWSAGEALWSRLPYRYGEIPADLAGLGGAIIFLASYHWPRWRPWRGTGFYLALLLLLGPGLLVNGLAKDLTGRPRPYEVVDFGGFWPFHRPWDFGTAGQGQSFISGHASMAFYWFALQHLLRDRGQRWLAFWATLGFGLWMGLARMAQGGHFLSDILLCGALMWSLAALLSPLIVWQPPARFWARPKVLLCLASLAVALLLLGHVVFEQRDLVWERPGSTQRLLATQRLTTWQPDASLDAVDLDLGVERGDLNVNFNAEDDGQRWPLRVQEELQGLGSPVARATLTNEPHVDSQLFRVISGSLVAKLRQELHGLWWAIKASYDISLPKHVAVDARLKTAQGLLTIAGLPEDRQILITGSVDLQTIPSSFHPYGDRSWLQDGAQPQIALDLSAPRVRFLP